MQLWDRNSKARGDEAPEDKIFYNKDMGENGFYEVHWKTSNVYFQVSASWYVYKNLPYPNPFYDNLLLD